jgi:hypothetical protein
VYAATTYIPVVSEDFNGVSPSDGRIPNPIINANWQIVGESTFAGQYKLRMCVTFSVSDWNGC